MTMGHIQPEYHEPSAPRHHRPVLIALTANAMGAGKSVVANHLVERHGFTLVKFAGPLKEMTRALLRSIGYETGEVERFVEGDLKETGIPELGITCRRLQQLIGTEFGRDLIDQNIWANLTAARCERLLAVGRDVVIDDMRYPNELDAVRPLGAYVVRIVRANLADPTGHSSEGGLTGAIVDGAIYNGSTVEHLREHADDILRHARSKQSLVN